MGGLLCSATECVKDTRLCSKDIPKAYIVCEEDRAIPPAFQYQMAAVLPDAQCFSLPTSHSPFFSAPKALAQQLSDIARVELMSV